MTDDVMIEARLWADQLERDLADPGIRSGTMMWMPVSAIQDVAAVLRKLTTPDIVDEVRRLQLALHNLLESDAYCHGEGSVTIGSFDEPAVIAAWAALSGSSHKGKSNDRP